VSTLIDIRTEVFLNSEFDPTIYLSAVNGYINRGLRSISHKIDFYSEESSYAIPTVAGTGTYAWPSDLGRIRYLRNVDDATTLLAVRLREVDESPISTGKPFKYATDASSLALYPTPDGVYNLSLRYWALPPLLVNDTDVPAIPEDYHDLLIFYALQRLYAKVEDVEMSSYWAQQWASGLADMKVDVKFPSGDGPRQIQSMWENPYSERPYGFTIPS
jgi:hypothetical protein